MFQLLQMEEAGAVVRSPSASVTIELTAVEASFAGQVATAVWLGYLDEDAAHEALMSYAIACHLCERAHSIKLREALLAEYRHWRERQDLAS